MHLRLHLGVAGGLVVFNCQTGAQQILKRLLKANRLCWHGEGE